MTESNAAKSERSPGFKEPDARSLHWLMIAVVAAVTLSVFSVVRNADFVPWDDDINIYNNPHIQGITAQSLKWMFTDSSYVHRYMPLGWLSFAVDYQLANGFNPTTYHIGNLLLHTLNAVLVFVLLAQLLKAAKPDAPARALSIAAAIGALFWSIHPLRAEPVAWSSARIYHVAMLFVLTSTFAYVKFITGEKRKPLHYCLAAILFLFAALTYPIVIGFPVVLVALDLFPFRRIALTKEKIFSGAARKVWLEKLPFFAIGVLVLGATLWNRTAATRFVPAASLDEFGVLPRAAQAFYVWAAYLWKTCWPANLSPTYTELLNFNWWQPRFVCSFLLVCALTFLFIRQRNRWPAALALWIAYLALLFPMLGLMEHPHYVYDRYSFLVGALCSVPIAWLVLHVWQRPLGRALFVTSAGAALVLLGGLSFRQAAVWNNAHTFLPYMISQLGEHPVRAKQDFVYGVILMRENRTEEAEKSLRNAIRFNANNSDAHTYLGDVLSDQGKFTEALTTYRRALELNSNDLRARQGLAMTLGGMKQFDAAIAEFKHVLLADARNANVLHNIAVTFSQMGETDQAADYYRRAQAIRSGGNPPSDRSTENKSSHEKETQ